ncbi:MAG: sulfotransferase domain-containing protein [Steroidobacteraceae bacterium]
MSAVRAEQATAPRFANFIIGGTEKAGTTSVFDNLGAHPEVCAASRKETDFFRSGYTGEAGEDAQNYAAFFARCDQRSPIFMEASPGYLGEARSVAPRIRSLAPDAKLLFILRDPLDRLYSSYHFHRGKLNLPEALSFEDYVSRCMAYDRGTARPEELGLDEWYLKVLRFGCYAEFLALYRSQLPAGNIKVMFFESLARDETGFMVELSRFLRIDADFWAGYELRKSNVTFSGRNKLLHRLAMGLNTAAEPILRRVPAVKRQIVRAYKAVNQQREGYDPMQGEVRAALIDYYGPSVRDLGTRLGVEVPDSWRYLLRTGAAS